MKKLLALTTVWVMYLPGFSQVFMADELLKLLQCNDYNCVSERVAPKGFDIALNKETEGYKLYAFNSRQLFQNESNNTVHRPYRLDFTIHIEDKSITLAQTVGDNTTREQLLEDFKNLGFKYVHTTKTRSVYDNSAQRFESENYPGIVLNLTNFEKKEQGRNFMEYEFELWRSTQKMATKP